MRTPWHALIAECIGAGLLSFAVLVSLHASLPLATPVVAAVTLAMLVYIFGPISGAHVNPAVTAGLWTVGKISSFQAAAYIVAQLLGGVIAWQLYALMTGTNPSLPVSNDLSVFLSEAVGAAVLVCGVCSVAFGKTHPAASGFVVGGSLLVGILIAVSFGFGILNPAVAVGLNAVSFFTILGPLVGGAGGALLYRFLVDLT